MKILALAFLLFGIAAALPYEDLERAKEGAILSFLQGMEMVPSLREAMGMDHPELNEIEGEVKTELIKTLKEALEHLLKRVKEAVDHGKMVKEEMKEHIEKIKEELRKLHENIGNKAKELLGKIADKVKGKFKEWIDKMRGKSEYSDESYLLALARVLTRLRVMIEEEGDPQEMADYIKLNLKDDIITQKLLSSLEDGGLDGLKHTVDRMLRVRITRDGKSMIEKMKDYLKEVTEDFQHHFSTFLDWLEEVYKSGAEAAKGRIENVKKVARKFLDHVKEVGKKTADEALEFFRPYKEDLGTLWDELDKSIKEAYGKQ